MEEIIEGCSCAMLSTDKKYRTPTKELLSKNKSYQSVEAPRMKSAPSWKLLA